MEKGLDGLTWVYGESVLYIDFINYFYFQVRSKFPWARDTLAQQMTHRATTQDQYYLLQQTKRDSANIVKLIEKCMTQDEVHTVSFYFVIIDLNIALFKKIT